MSEGQMNTITLCVSMYSEVDKGPSKYDLQAGFEPVGCHLSRLAISHIFERREFQTSNGMNKTFIST